MARASSWAPVVAILVVAPSFGCIAPRASRPPIPSPSHIESAPSVAAPAPTHAPSAVASRPDQVGVATWYGAAFAGRKTANGERFDPSKHTAAHRSLPFGTWVEVRRADTGRSVRVRINDRGPYAGNDRVIDLSKRAAEDLEMVRDGVAKVEIRVVGPVGNPE